jgi:hypothetical protein
LPSPRSAAHYRTWGRACPGLVRFRRAGRAYGDVCSSHRTSLAIPSTANVRVRSAFFPFRRRQEDFQMLSAPLGAPARGATGARVPTPQPITGRLPAPTGCLSAPALPAICVPLRVSPVSPVGGPTGAPRGRLESRLERHCWRSAGNRRSEPPGARAISLSFQAPDRPHVGCRMAPSTSRRSRRCAYFIRQPRRTGDRNRSAKPIASAGTVDGE